MPMSLLEILNRVTPLCKTAYTTQVTGFGAGATPTSSKPIGETPTFTAPGFGAGSGAAVGVNQLTDLFKSTMPTTQDINKAHRQSVKQHVGAGIAQTGLNALQSAGGNAPTMRQSGSPEAAIKQFQNVRNFAQGLKQRREVKTKMLGIAKKIGV